MGPFDNSFPALAGRPVTQAHVNRCIRDGHASHTVDGLDDGVCPRCGAVKERTPEAMDLITQFQKYCKQFELIAAEGEEYDRDQALELISDLLNNNNNTINTTFTMCAALARAALNFEIDEDAQKEWDDTQEYLDDNA